MDAATIAAKNAFGYFKSGSVVGSDHILYRPQSASLPALDPSNLIASIPFISSATSNFSFTAPAKPGNAYRYGLFDTTQTQVGDYIDGPTGTFFVASQNVLEPPMCVLCDAVLTLLRDAKPSVTTTGFGATPVSGNSGAQRTNKTTLMTHWPGSLLQGTKGQSNPSDLPDDVRAPWSIILLPAILGVTIGTMDQLEDNLGRVWTVSSVELSSLGYRLTASYSGT